MRAPAVSNRLSAPPESPAVSEALTVPIFASAIDRFPKHSRRVPVRIIWPQCFQAAKSKDEAQFDIWDRKDIIEELAKCILRCKTCATSRIPDCKWPWKEQNKAKNTLFYPSNNRKDAPRRDRCYVGDRFLDWERCRCRRLRCSVER